MSTTLATIESGMKELEGMQVQVGKLQVKLLETMLAVDFLELQESLQTTLIMLEAVQRKIGEVQVELLRCIPAAQQAEEKQEEEGPTIQQIHQGLGAQQATEPALHFEDVIEPIEWLRERGIEVTGLRQPNPLDEVADRAAFSLGLNFERLQDLYETIKRRVNGVNVTSFSVRDLSPDVIGLCCQFAQALHKCSFLTKYRYLRGEKLILFDVMNDGRVQNFFTGDWYERFVLQLIRNALHRYAGVCAESQVVIGAQVRLPDDTMTELDILAGLPGRNMLWVECKTGQWQNYTERFKSLNRKHFRLPRDRAILALIDKLTPAQQASASELIDMSVLHISEVAEWINNVVNVAARIS